PEELRPRGLALSLLRGCARLLPERRAPGLLLVRQLRLERVRVDVVRIDPDQQLARAGGRFPARLEAHREQQERLPRGHEAEEALIRKLDLQPMDAVGGRRR